MSNTKDYTCAITPTDHMRAYVTENEIFNGKAREFFAVVLHNDQGHKVSVLLTAADAEALHAQLNDWCFGVTE